MVPLYCSFLPNVKVLSLLVERIKRLLGGTNVFGRTFIFCHFLCNAGALDLRRHVVDLSVSLTMSRPAETTVKLEHVKTWILKCGFAKFQPFWSDFPFLSLVYFNPYCLRGPCSIDAFRVPVFDWVFWKFENNVSVLLLSWCFKLFSR